MKVLLKSKVDELVAALTAAGQAFFGPVKDGDVSFYGRVERGADLALDLVAPDRTLKELFFPRTEPMMTYEIKKQQVATQEVAPPDQPRVIFGVRPCDAAGLAIDDGLFGWDYKDSYWFERRNNSIIVSIACTKADEFCMCTSMKLGPDDPKGSDVLLRPLQDSSGWQLEAVTDKGKGLVERISTVLAEAAGAVAPVAKVVPKFDLAKVTEWVKKPENFDSPFWREISRRCLGCGACTFMCPTCHCFDVQDEGDIYKGVRRKNWDSCSFAMFTLHTSGHNPRPTQMSRWRQRIMHKFNYYPGKFQACGCSGCGRCTRQCPVDMGITETLQELSK